MQTAVYTREQALEQCFRHIRFAKETNAYIDSSAQAILAATYATLATILPSAIGITGPNGELDPAEEKFAERYSDQLSAEWHADLAADARGEEGV